MASMASVRAPRYPFPGIDLALGGFKAVTKMIDAIKPIGAAIAAAHWRLKLVEILGRMAL